ncbi:hypothetical protein ACEN9F_11745 [Duganella sp. CT11-25]|jgi:hypothetical protein|uniref:hypothetical protein n=1 Tax=unclassified Duganella TaxID=2636909 RepID=UPI0039AF3214
MEISSTIITLQPGMYILRHPKGGLAPLGIARGPGNGGGRMETLGTPATHGAVLRDGADCIVVHVSEAPVELLVSAFLVNKNDPVPALRLDRVGLDGQAATPPAPARTPAAAGANAIQIGPSGISLIGHIERQGDAVAAPGERLGDPAGELRLEGFQVMWPDRPEGVELAYGAAVEGGGALPIVKSGKFCGTRNAARRITEVTFALIGPRAAQFRLEGEAHFSGGFRLPVQTATPLSGPSGLEHLTALSLRAVPATPPAPGQNPWDDAAHTHVFKAAPAAKRRKNSSIVAPETAESQP